MFVTSGLLATPRSRARARRASSSFPLLRRKRGDSGSASTHANWTTARTRVTDIMRRQPPRGARTETAKATAYEHRIPDEMKSCGMVERRPRLLLREHSAMYTGTTAPALPMARPATRRARTRIAAVGAHESSAPATAKSAEETSIVPRRPRESERREAEIVPAREPRVVAVTMRPCTAGRAARSNSGTIERSAPPITPVL
mmetsp:Transcript_7989/g.19731  ORF Transcript_7989/g.19731 Transcript_7989/m.19731 type:complete len:201 (+) Transcript_7989:1410-2012(+)